VKSYINRKDKYGRTLFNYYVGSNEKIKMFIKNGANVNIPDDGGYTPLFIIDGNDDIETTKLLLEAGADVNYQEPQYGNTILHNNCEYRHPNLEIIEMFLQAGASLSIKNHRGHTPHDTARHNLFHHDILVPLLEKYM
jgi:ankyrin repeat protein